MGFIGEFKTQEQGFKALEEKKASGWKGQISESTKFSETEEFPWKKQPGLTGPEAAKCYSKKAVSEAGASSVTKAYSRRLCYKASKQTVR